MKFSMPQGKSLPQILFPNIFFPKVTPPTPLPPLLLLHKHTHTHTPAEKEEGTIKVYLNRDTILQGSLKTAKLIHKVINQQIRSLPFLNK